MGKYLLKANAVERKCPSRFFCVLASPDEVTINFRYLFSTVFPVFINKYTSSTNMFNKPH